MVQDKNAETLGAKRPEGELSTIQKAASRYADRTNLRAAVQAIPYIGGSLDTLLAGSASKIVEKRFAQFVDDLQRQMETVQAEKLDKAYLESEQFFSHFQKVGDCVLKEHEQEKIELLARTIKASSLEQNASKRDIFIAIATGLAASDVLVLSKLIEIDSQFTGQDRLNNRNRIDQSRLQDELASLDPSIVAAACHALGRYGLIRDGGIGLIGYQPGAWIVTDLGHEFASFLQ